MVKKKPSTGLTQLYQTELFGAIQDQTLLSDAILISVYFNESATGCVMLQGESGGGTFLTTPAGDYERTRNGALFVCGTQSAVPQLNQNTSIGGVSTLFTNEIQSLHRSWKNQVIQSVAVFVPPSHVAAASSHSPPRTPPQSQSSLPLIAPLSPPNG